MSSHGIRWLGGSVFGDLAECVGPLYRLAILSLCACCCGATYRTENFVVVAAAPEFARRVAVAAEEHRQRFAAEWFETDLAPWRQPCGIHVTVASHVDPQGATSFSWERGILVPQEMHLRGAPRQILDGVLPHEIAHTVLATYFKRYLPRWIEEGISCSAEDSQSQEELTAQLRTAMNSGRRLTLDRLFAPDYPRDVFAFYSHAYSLTQFLLDLGGKGRFVRFIHVGLRENDWDVAVHQEYGFSDLKSLQSAWLQWTDSRATQ